MEFVDSARIRVFAGKGGDGALSFLRRKNLPKGGPDGGDGGGGGSVFLRGENALNTLFKFRYQSVFSAADGERGKGQEKRGRSARDLMIQVPLGTRVFDAETSECIGEITHHDETLLVAKGGICGLGNTRFKSAVNQTPRQTRPGRTGESRQLNLELNLIADVGLLGAPNAGKSSVLAKLSNARPKIADYPFTTLHPELGVVAFETDEIVIADIPGLIENASAGAGLGFAFLKHLSRTKLLLHIVDLFDKNESDAAGRYQMIINELKKHSRDLAAKPRVLALNKIDLIAPKNRQTMVRHFLEKTHYSGKLFTISAASGEGCRELARGLKEMIHHGG